jgi:alkylation response protein AidB-like acyl-CoA dehydrogenase
MDAADRDLFRRTVQQATATHTGTDLDSALQEMGWPDAFADDPAAAVSCLFVAQGYDNVRSSALRWISGSPVVAPGVLSGDEPSGGLDPELGLVRDDTAGLATVHPWAQIALGYEMVGSAHRMIELAREHALERIQFGRPISQFQAIRHRLAEAHVAVEGAQDLLDAAAGSAGPDRWLAAMAKAVSGRAARTTARHAQQVLAGIGFTAEHAFHRYFRRIMALDHLHGSTRSLTRELGATVLEQRQLPPLLPL